MRVIGLMSGTSIDGINVAVCEFTPCATASPGWSMELLGFREEPFPAALRLHLLDLLRREEVPLDELTEVNFLLGEVFADAAVRALVSLSLVQESIDLIASHGQTIYHLAVPGRARATLQMGESAVVAARAGATVVADFRVADVAAGGEGAPLVSAFDALLFTHPGRTRAVQNIGGMANVTFLPAGAGPDAAYAFDTGPGNILIDYAARHFTAGAKLCDRDGRFAADGQVHQGLLAEVLSHPYFSRPPPKTTGRELFGDDFAAAIVSRAGELGLTMADTLATLTAITAQSIVEAYGHFGPARIDEVILSGGGARNPTLIGELRRRLPGVTLGDGDEYGVPSEAKEAMAFAVLGYEALHGRPAHLPRCTGASRRAILGKITPGANYGALMHTVFGGGAEGTGGT